MGEAAPAVGSTPAELIEHLTANVFEYHRVGYDRRPMTFFATGTVGWGAARCELFWRLGKPQFYHNPSLVHHAGVVSLSDGSFHQAVDFHPLWRA